MIETIKRGSKGQAIRVLQYFLEVEADGKFGAKTQTALKTFQADQALKADGICGPATWSAIINQAPTLIVGFEDKWVYIFDVFMSINVTDGIFHESDSELIKDYQEDEGLTVNGKVDIATWNRLFGVTQKKSSSDKPVDYKQFDSKWANVVYTKNNTYDRTQTIKSSGCGPTSMADIIATWFDKNITPVEMAKIAVDKGYRTENSGTSYGFFKYVANLYNLRYKQTTSFSVMQACLADGGLVVVNFGKSKWTNGGWVLAS